MAGTCDAAHKKQESEWQNAKYYSCEICVYKESLADNILDESDILSGNLTIEPLQKAVLSVNDGREFGVDVSFNLVEIVDSGNDRVSVGFGSLGAGFDRSNNV